MINLFSHAKISFVVICYNREKYIAECLDSILQQPIEKEIICIDDHSTDSTFEILKQYKRKNKNIKIYQNEENLGTVITRIRGLSHCKGEFIIMVDADDQVIGDYRQLYDTAVKSDADVLEFSYEIRSDSKPRENVKLEENTFTKSESLDKYKQKTVKNVLCNKLVARKCYETFKGKLNEDIKQRNFSDVVYFRLIVKSSWTLE